MSDDPKSTLQEAYDLIEAGALDEARELLDGYLSNNPNDADGWWLYANAVEDPAEGEAALRRVLLIDPNYADAREILEEMEAAGVLEEESDELAFLQETGDSPDFLDEVQDEDESEFDFDEALPFDDSDEIPEAETVDDLELSSEDEFDFDDEFDLDEDEEPEAAPSRIRTLIGLLILAIVVIAVVVIFIVNPFNRQDDIQVAGNTQEPPAATAEVTETSEVLATAETAATVETAPVADDLAAPFYTALEGLNVIEGSAAIEDTSLGNTFAVSICADSTEAVIRNNVDLGLRLMADQSATVQEQAEAIGVRLVNCSGDNSILRYIVAPLDQAVAFANSDISLTEFSTSWEAEPLN